MTCERDFIEGVKMFEGIAETMELRETKSDLESLNEDIISAQTKTGENYKQELGNYHDASTKLDIHKDELIDGYARNRDEREKMITRGEIGREEEDERNIGKQET